MNPGEYSPAGLTLRRFRHQRGLTLEQAASSLGISISVLSRKERGQQEIKREEVRLIIEQFQLSPAEAHELWTSAGFVPEPGSVPETTGRLRGYASQHLPKLAFPALLLTLPGYVLAWNQEYELIWQPSRLRYRPLHILDLLFSTEVPPELSEAWERYTWQMILLFHYWVARTIQQPQVHKLLQALSRRYGDRFDTRWLSLQTNQAMRAGMPGLREVLVPWQSAQGPATFVLLRGSAQMPQSHELLVFVPFGSDSQTRYRHLLMSYPDLLTGRKPYFRDVPTIS